VIHESEGRSAATQGTFGNTPWTAVLAAARSAAPGFCAAWQRLAEAYWYPLYAYIRRRGHSAPDSGDLTQGFFTHLISTEALEGLVAGEGRFRSFLLVCLRRFLADQHRHASAGIRRPPGGLISIDQTAAEGRYQIEPPDRATPEELFERRWARALLDQALARLEAHYSASGKRRLFAGLVAHLAGDPGAVPHGELAGRLATTEASIRNEMYRLRQRFRVLFREEVAATVPEAEVEREMRHLLRVLSG
jgi:RNA polymerase sigma-70 factor (ECF subfamily)